MSRISHQPPLTHSPCLVGEDCFAKLTLNENERGKCCSADWSQRSHSRSPAYVLLHRIERILQRRHELLRETGKYETNNFLILSSARKSKMLDVNTFLYSLQGIQFYTQIKTVTSQWKAEDATLKSPAVTMPTMGR